MPQAMDDGPASQQILTGSSTFPWNKKKAIIPKPSHHSIVDRQKSQ
jgi:hypothetical protein